MLVDLLITACSRAWDDDGEVLASGIGVVQRLGASLAMHKNPDLMMTDSEAYMVSEPVPIGPRDGYEPQRETWMGFSRIFDNVWSGKRHALVGPTQIDRFGQANISAIGDYDRPKIQMLGVRGFPGNSISHANSFFVPNHSKRVFVDGEVDMVASVGYNPDRVAEGWKLDDIDIRIIVTNLCVMDFRGPDHQARLVSLHPGIEVDQVVENTGFELCIPPDVAETPQPTSDELKLIAQYDPHELRASAVK
ncbi:MAG: ketoacid CoA transferase [Gammaproteobacteria bacterium]|nr:ketoacid CoA transferase [Gammaproteobacteria bacterium]MDH3371916.1 ketoacid CoA transferase [Gammaproteobacteria bacterium]MDH3407755.1 ketoacid CoA transferase [Gammaproteobacteria bacterium]MDH3551126.1 ketoacid CoA transferase [Gammaproteobacteria bacterium]